MTKVVVKHGTLTHTIETEENLTAQDIANNPVLAAIFNLSDRVTVLRNGIELGNAVEIEDGDEVEVVQKSNDKG